MDIQRKQWLDIAKGLAILGVIVVHFPEDLPWGISWMTFHVNTFFVIAGYLIYQNGIADFRYIKEIKKYVLLFVKLSTFYIVFWVIIKYIGHANGMSDFILLQLYKTLTFTGIGTLWFLPTFLLGKILFITLLKFFPKKFLFIVDMILTVTVSCICYYLYRNGIMGTIHYKTGAGLHITGIILDLLSVIFQGVIASGFVCLGYFLHFIFENMLNQSFICKNKNLMVVCVIGGGYFAILNYYISSFYHSDLHLLRIRYPIGFLIASSCGCICIVLIAILLSQTKIISGILSYLGKNSLIIMTTHLEYNIIILSHKIVSLLHIELRNNILRNLEVIIVTIICELVIIKIVKSTPLKYLYNLKR